jgi:lysophospholipase L1-like esterase
VSQAAARRGPRLRAALSRAALALAGTALALAAGELWARVARPEHSELPPPAAQHPPDLPRLHGIWELARPNVRGIYKDVLHRTNSMGARGPETPLVPPPGSFRIVLLGDSIAMGEGVEESETYASLLARLLGEADLRRAFEVVNLGVSGVTARHAANRLDYVGRRYHPDLIVYGYTLNDIEGAAYRREPPADREAFRELLLRHSGSRSRLLRAVWPRLVTAWSAFSPLPGSYERELAQNYHENPDAWGEVESALDRVAARSRELRVCALLFVHPRLQDLSWLHPFTAFYAQVAEAARTRGFHVAIAFDALRGERAGSLRFSVADPHPNAEGHRLLALALRDAVLSLPRDCLEPRARPGAARR